MSTNIAGTTTAGTTIVNTTVVNTTVVNATIANTNIANTALTNTAVTNTAESSTTSASTQPVEILLCTLNARFQHASLGLRYLYANLGALQHRARIHEFVMGTKAEVIVEQILAQSPSVVGFGVYIWNVEEITTVLGILKAAAPHVKCVLGGPEVSFKDDLPSLASYADHIITGQADISFAKLAKQLLDGPRPLQKVIAGESFELDDLALPYAYYTNEDIAKRYLYVEASRGCPFKCEFCLSSLDKTADPFNLDAFLVQMQSLYERGARMFKFVDRTFNLNINTSLKILDFFLEKIEQNPSDPVFAHFELVPDHLPEKLKAAIVKFPPGTLQFEIGIQTFNPEVQTLISRRQNDQKAEDNIRWLVTQTQAHMHVDLIAGLPGESLESFGEGLDRLYKMGPHEIQLGILKRLRGTPIIRHTQTRQMRYNPRTPYNVLATDALSFAQVQELTRFARYWDLIVNSGRFPNTLKYVFGQAPFARFRALSSWLYQTTDATHKIALERLFDLLHAWLIEGGIQTKQVEEALTIDYLATKAKGKLGFMQRGTSIEVAPRKRDLATGKPASPDHGAATTSATIAATTSAPIGRATPKRQSRFVAKSTDPEH